MCKLVLSIVNQPNTPSESVNLYLWLAAASLRKYANINYQSIERISPFLLCMCANTRLAEILFTILQNQAQANL